MSRRNQSGKRIAIGFDPKKLEEELHAAQRTTPAAAPVSDGLADWERELLGESAVLPSGIQLFGDPSTSRSFPR